MALGHVAQIRPMDVANGKGIRVSIFVTGCSRGCKNCFNEAYQDPSYGEVWTNKNTKEVITYLLKPQVSGLSVLGGEPMENTWLTQVLNEIKHTVDKPIWIYSGYTFEEILKDPDKKALLNLCDTLVDGPFVEEKKNLRLAFRGSENQRILDVKKSLDLGQAVWDTDYINQ